MVQLYAAKYSMAVSMMMILTIKTDDDDICGENGFDDIFLFSRNFRRTMSTAMMEALKVQSFSYEWKQPGCKEALYGS